MQWLQLSGIDHLKRTVLLCSMGAFILPAHAWNVPSNLGEDDDQLTWSGNSPSYNIYEDGLYIGTVHGQSHYGPIFENSRYQVTAHDHGSGFTPLSRPFLFIDDDEGDDDPDDGELEFDEFEIYLELNNTDGDLGIHSLIDGDEWTRLTYEDVNGRKLIDIKMYGSMKEQGLTELFFESSEPTFDDLDPAEFFSRFPAGIYDVEGKTIDGEEIEGESELSHVLPAAPVVYIGAMPMASSEGCEDEDADNPVASLDTNGRLPITWDPVTSHHPDLGAPGVIEVDQYQVAIETESFDLLVDVDADTLGFTIPAALVSSGDWVKIEVLVRDGTHNQVATEACVLAI